ncbi:MAG: hypothetical protein M3Y87_12490 [Myxococcota bacterium]|nr:hypothetical protein [Myxococcota bacterium]
MIALHTLARRPESALAIAALLMLGACGGEPPPVDGVDGGTDDAAVARGTLRIGEGELEFREVQDGDVLQIARGCQGSQHVWMTLRSEDMDPRGMIVELSIVRASDETLVSGAFRLRLSFVEDASGAFAQLTGLTLQVPDPDSALGEDLLVRGRIEDRNGVEARTERRVRIEWGTQICEPPLA